MLFQELCSEHEETRRGYWICRKEGGIGHGGRIGAECSYFGQDLCSKALEDEARLIVSF